MVKTAKQIIDRTRTTLSQQQQVAAIEMATKGLSQEEEYRNQLKRQAANLTAKQYQEGGSKRYVKRQALVKKLKGYKKGKKGRVVKPKQPKFSKAVMGLTKAFLPEGAEGFGGTQVSGKKPGGGRGRPAGSYKSRYVPGKGVVKVPTHIYNKMMSEAKAKMRLAEAQRQAMAQQQMEAEQIAMSQDPRFQQSSEDAWADSEDMEHEANIERIKQQQLLEQQQMAMQKQQQPSLLRRGVSKMVERSGRINLMGSQMEKFQREGREPPQQLDPYGRPQVDMNRHRPVEPKVRLFQGNSNLFPSKNEVNRADRNIMNQRNELF